MDRLRLTRILADLPNEDVKWLDQRAAELGKSRASVLRDAVATYKAQSQPANGTEWIERGFGAWKDRNDIGDAVEWQRRERASSTRPWDVDYEEVRAEFPDLFDAEDDRQRQIHLDMLAGRYPDAKKGVAK
ncbi:ribbon-helix-helix protein, CopG family [Sphingomonas mali]|uniref:ribbon-helix-helix protein, CopG family n=1 Tax=Sphingomonas mali TaxID=40682 RepID=UPI000A6AE41B